VIGGDEYVLKLNMNVFADLEDHYGKPVHKLLESMRDEMGVSMLRQLLYRMLRLKHSGLSIEDVGAKMQMDETAGYARAVSTCISRFMTGKDPEIREEEVSDEDPLSETGSGTGTS